MPVLAVHSGTFAARAGDFASVSPVGICGLGFLGLERNAIMLGGTRTGLSPWPHVEGVMPTGWSHSHPSWGHLLELGNEPALGAVGSPGPGKPGPWRLVSLATAGLWVPRDQIRWWLRRSWHWLPGCRSGGRGGGGAGRWLRAPRGWAASTLLAGQQLHVGAPEKKRAGRCPEPPPVGAGAGRPSQVGWVGAAGGAGLWSAAQRESCLSVGEAGAWGRGHPSAPGPELVLRVGPSRGVAPPGPGSWTLGQHLPKQPAQEGAWSRCLPRPGEACP